MSAIHAFFLAILQGVTELFPISSLGHTVILPPVLHWKFEETSPAFLPFIVVLHVGTAAALLLYFWRDWFEVLRGILGTGAAVQPSRRLLGNIIIATLPAVAIGFLFERTVRGLFALPLIAAVFLIVNGFLLLLGERLRSRDPEERGYARIDSLRWEGALAIGVWQCAAFIPGISRSGAAMVGGLVSGLAHADAAHFSFLIATPIIAGAAVLEVPKLLRLPGAHITPLAIAAGVVAGVTAYLSTAFLMRYFRRRDFEDALFPFAIYCWAAGAAATVYFLI
jgi:undecaprenyl-diphosphatase